MTMLAIGATGRAGRHVVDQLVQRGAKVRVLPRDPSKASFPAGVDIVQGELLDIDALRSAFNGVSTLFLLNAVTGDEFTGPSSPSTSPGSRASSGWSLPEGEMT